ncbi:hypothetical protein DL98DRAFT_582736 [Cadophora sp. DSE1049]|nr:hypothetical protein DL98DRAFT_582736 [Cadophora sp. DSE1049]
MRTMEECECDSDSPYHTKTPTPPMDEASTEHTATIPLFKDLPSELQDAIWDRALPGPGIVYIQAKRITRGRTRSETFRQREQDAETGNKKKRDRDMMDNLFGEERDAVSSPYYKRTIKF